MEASEVVSSAGSISDGSQQTENDDTLSEACSEDTLNLVEGAILRMLKKHSSQEHDSIPAGVVESRQPRGRFSNVRDEEQGSAASENSPPPRFSYPEDKELLATLLDQVRDLRRNQRQGSRRPREKTPADVQEILKPTRGGSFDRRRASEKKPSPANEELRMTLEAAAMAAKAAADAAEAAAASVARNTEAIESLVSSMKLSEKKQKKAKSVDEKLASQKAIVKSNQITHWILAFMAVTTVVWRFGVVKVARKVSSKISDPLGYVGGLIGSGDDSSKEKPPVEKTNLLDKLPQIDLPSILPSDADQNNGEETKGEKTSVSPNAAAGVKTKEVETKEVEKTTFGFGNLLNSSPRRTSLRKL